MIARQVEVELKMTSEQCRNFVNEVFGKALGVDFDYVAKAVDEKIKRDGIDFVIQAVKEKMIEDGLIYPQVLQAAEEQEDETN